MTYRWIPLALLAALALFALALPEQAAGTPGKPADVGDTAWLLTATGLVLLMTPGLAFFYAGHGQHEERHLDDAPELHRAGRDLAAVGRRRIQSVLRRQHLRTDRRPADLLHVSRRRHRHRAEPGANHSVRALRDVPVEVRRDHAGADHRIVRRARALLRLPRVHGALLDRDLQPARALDVASAGLPAPVGRARFRRRHRRPHVSGLRRARRRDRARAAPDVTKTAAFTRRRTSLTCCSAPACCGSDGSASTPDRRSPRTRRRQWPSRRRTPHRRRRCWRGSCSTWRATAAPRRWGPASARSSVSSRSPRRPAT